MIRAYALDRANVTATVVTRLYVAELCGTACGFVESGRAMRKNSELAGADNSAVLIGSFT